MQRSIRSFNCTIANLFVSNRCEIGLSPSFVQCTVFAKWSGMEWILLRSTTCSSTTSDCEKVCRYYVDCETDIVSFEEGEGISLDITDLHDLSQFDLLIRPLSGYYINKTFTPTFSSMQISVSCDCSRVLPFSALQSEAGRSGRKQMA